MQAHNLQMGTNRGASQAGSTTFGSRDQSTRQSLLATPTTSYVSRHLCTCQDFLTNTLTSRQPGWPTFITGRTPGQARQDRLLLGRRDRSTRQSLLAAPTTSYVTRHLCTCQDFLTTTLTSTWPTFIKRQGKPAGRIDCFWDTKTDQPSRVCQGLILPPSLQS